MITLTQTVRLLGLTDSEGVALVLYPGCGFGEQVWKPVKKIREQLEMNRIFVTHIDPFHFKYSEDREIAWEFTITTGKAAETRALIRALHDR